jgi:endonuclease/exonuclease/phosphatase (EEP) superfamily protein YafD
MRAPRRLVARRAIACAAAVATGAATLQWMSWGRSARTAEPASRSALRIVHLNPRWPGDATDLAAAMMAQSADVYAISEAGAVLRAPAVRAAGDAGAVTLHVGRFAIVSRCPVREARAVYDDGSTAASWIRFGATDALPEWTMLMVDAPRSLRVSRHEIFTALRAALDAMSLGAPDVVVGDMNTVPGSRAVSDAWPSLRDASQEAGRGVRGTFPRELPLWAIDRCLVTPKWRILEWRSWDPGRGAHRGQRVEVDVQPISP